MSDEAKLENLRERAARAKQRFINQYGEAAYKGLMGAVARSDGQGGARPAHWTGAASTRLERGDMPTVEVVKKSTGPRRKRTPQERTESMMQRLLSEALKSRQAGGGFNLPEDVLRKVTTMYRKMGVKDLTVDDIRHVAAQYLEDAEKRAGVVMAPEIKGASNGS